jgi:hypothetical protein
MTEVMITQARVSLDDGLAVALIEAVTIGGGTQVVTVDGVPEERQHPIFHRFHVRLLAPDRMVPDALHEAETFEEAVALASKYADKRAEHAARIEELASDLQV